jgi:hypothetical protein
MTTFPVSSSLAPVHIPTPGFQQPGADASPAHHIEFGAARILGQRIIMVNHLQFSCIFIYIYICTYIYLQYIRTAATPKNTISTVSYSSLAFDWLKQNPLRDNQLHELFHPMASSLLRTVTGKGYHNPQ